MATANGFASMSEERRIRMTLEARTTEQLKRLSNHPLLTLQTMASTILMERGETPAPRMIALKEVK